MHLLQFSEIDVIFSELNWVDSIKIYHRNISLQNTLRICNFSLNEGEISHVETVPQELFVSPLNFTTNFLKFRKFKGDFIWNFVT